MPSITRSALVMFSAQQMYELVNDIDAYPQFLPGCVASRVVSQSDNTITAALDVSKAGIRKTFTTKNILTPHEHIRVELVDGPFKALNGGWTFTPLDEDACKVELELYFEFTSRLVEFAFGGIFKELANAMVHSLVIEPKRYMAMSLIRVEVVYALPYKQIVLSLNVAPESDVQQVIVQSGILQQCPEINLDKQMVGVFGRQVKLDSRLRAGDRVEIYRPLLADPKDIRRRRAEQAKEEGRADKVTGGRPNPGRADVRAREQDDKQASPQMTPDSASRRHAED